MKASLLMPFASVEHQIGTGTNSLGPELNAARLLFFRRHRKRGSSHARPLPVGDIAECEKEDQKSSPANELLVMLPVDAAATFQQTNRIVHSGVQQGAKTKLHFVFSIINEQ